MPSIVLTGLGRAHEGTLQEALGGPPRKFFVLAQRIVWGITQSDLIKVDVPRQCRSLVRLYPDTPASHLLDAYRLRAEEHPGADEALAKARALASGGHPLEFLVPSDAEWAGEVPEQKLVGVVPDRVWRVSAYEPMRGCSLPSQSTSTIIRTEAGELVIINPLPYRPAVRMEIDALGPVVALAIQGKAHSRHVETSAASFPGAKVFGSRGHLTHPPAAHLRFDGILAGERPALPDEIEEILVDGSELEEVLLLHRPSGLLVVQDIIAASLSTQGRTFLGRLYYFAFGLFDRIGCLAYMPMMWSDLPRFQEGIRSVLGSGYTDVVGAHWGNALVTPQQVQEFTEVLRWLAKLGGMTHKGLLVRYFAAQPTFMRDLFRYKLATRRV
ncbi:MAG: hypothetical protein GY716_09180 [bacterium]|nr:hypothetical protein [bacterium]